MKRSYTLYLQDIINAVNDIAKYTADTTEQEFLADSMKQSAVVWKITVIGEAVKHISRHIRLKYKDVPWTDMIRMRDKITHAYFGIRYEIVWRVCKEELPSIQPTLQRILEELMAKPFLRKRKVTV